MFFYTHAHFSEHDPGPGHPEQKARHAAVLRGLNQVEGAKQQEAPLGRWQDIERVHPQTYIEALKQADSLLAAGDRDRLSLDADTHIMSASLEAALRAVGGACAGVDALMSGQTRHAYVAGRPPGHHAEPDRAMGFCLFATASIAARYAQAQYGLARVAIVDFDVHHGNGTQAVFWNDPSVMFISSHQMPLYPGTGAASERGAHQNILNLPLRAGDDGAVFRQVWEEKAFPALRAFAPDLLVVSAGFDAHEDDPLGGLALEAEDFGWIGWQLRQLADAVCQGRLLSNQEGGYDLPALQASVAAYVIAAS